MSAPARTTIPVIKSHNPSNHIVIIVVVITTLTFLTVCARLYTKVTKHTFGPDDWAIIPALLLTIVHGILVPVNKIYGGLGKPLWDITLDEYHVWFKCIIASVFLYPVMTASIRISILLFYQRIFRRTLSKGQLLTKIIMAMMIPYVIIYELITAFLCHPISAFWNPFIRNTHCGDKYYYEYSVSLYAVSLAFDVMLLVLPIHTVWQLQISTKQKLSLMVVFVLGASSCVAVATKLALFVAEWPNYYRPDPRWAGNPLQLLIPPQFSSYGNTYWIPSQVEPCAAIIGCSLPGTWPLFVDGVGKLRWALSSLGSSRGKGSQESRSRARSFSRSNQIHASGESTTALHDPSEEYPLHSLSSTAHQTAEVGFDSDPVGQTTSGGIRKTVAVTIDRV